MLIHSPPNLEVVCIKLRLLDGLIISLSSVYVPPNPDISHFNQLIAFLKSLAANEKILIIVGDFNLPDICWTSLLGCSPLSNLFCDFVFDTNLAQLIYSPTHVKGNTLDILLTNSEHIISHISVSKPYDSLPSDHYKISFFIESNFFLNKTHKPLFVFDYKRPNYEGYATSSWMLISVIIVNLSPLISSGHFLRPQSQGV